MVIMEFTTREKLLLVVLISILIALSAFLANELILKSLNPPDGYQLVSNQNGVTLYKNQYDVFLEVKEANNPTKTYHSYCVGKKANVTVKFVKYTITSYKQVQSNPTVPAVQIYDSGVGETATGFSIRDMLGHNHLEAVDRGIVGLYD